MENKAMNRIAAAVTFLASSVLFHAAVMRAGEGKVLDGAVVAGFVGMVILIFFGIVLLFKKE